jgi:small subunit ribosomal protein S6
VVIINPEIEGENIPHIIEKITQFISTRGGVISEVTQWGKRKLAYPIKHFNEGSYIVAQFRLEPKMAGELETSLRLSEEILRHLLVKVKH